jgi:hypothetical protein
MMQTPDVVDAGRVLATLNDWRALLYVMVVTQATFIGLVIALVRALLKRSADMAKEREEMSQERGRMWAVSEKFGDAADKLGRETNRVVTELEVQRALNARLEGVVTNLESRVDRLIDKLPKGI